MCIRSAAYEEALELISYTKRLFKFHENIVVIKDIVRPFLFFRASLNSPYLHNICIPVGGGVEFANDAFTALADEAVREELIDAIAQDGRFGQSPSHLL